MKNLLLIILVFSCAFAASAQTKFGIRSGISTTNFNPKDLVILNQDDVEQFKISVDDAKYGFHFGLFAQIRKNKFFIQPEVIFNSSEIDYKVEDFENNLGSTIKSERFNYVDIPLMAGVKLGPLRLQAGPVGHFYVSSSSQLKDLEGYSEMFNDMALGVQYGVGLDIWRTVLDFKWERNFKNFGDHVVFDDAPYNFDGTQNRFIVSLGIKLF